MQGDFSGDATTTSICIEVSLGNLHNCLAQVLEVDEGNKKGGNYYFDGNSGLGRV